MALPWPQFWQDVREEDRDALSDVLMELLSAGVILGDSGRDRERYMLAHEYRKEIAEYFSPLQLEIIQDPDQSIIQLRPVAGNCGLSARFSKAETLLVLTLWRIYDETRLEQVVPTVVTSINDIWSRLKLYFEKIDPPRENQMRDMLGRLRRHRLVRIRWHEEGNRFGESQIEILPTLARVIPFDDASAWETQAALYRGGEEPEGDATQS